jgi:hypothetical protein
MILILEVTNEVKQKNGTSVVTFTPRFKDPLEGNVISGELFWTAPFENAQFTYGDQIVAELTEEEEIIVTK